MCELGVQEGVEHAPLWGPSVEDQRRGDVVSYLQHLEQAHQKVQDPIAQGSVMVIASSDDAARDAVGAGSLARVNMFKCLTHLSHGEGEPTVLGCWLR